MSTNDKAYRDAKSAPQGGPGVPPKPDYADALEKIRDAAMALAAVYQRMAAAVRKGEA
jgi:hypothetical protein